jgi:hypothetical protein
MIFLIQYSRREGSIKFLRSFDDSDRADAEAARLKIELNIDNSAEEEVVLLEAPSESALRNTHRRYFASASDLLRTAVDEAAAATTTEQ